ncbi:hypothetical protein CF65_00500 [Aggregatibacter actinomycetemcomitans HK1651]|nr:hypothetical protein CF65_00500 [Aggregatibacter actinomycetemcomitans HK1651]
MLFAGKRGMEKCEIIAVKTLEKNTALLGKVRWDFKLFFDSVD